MSQKRSNGNQEKENGVVKRLRISTEDSSNETESFDKDDGTDGDMQEQLASDVGVIEHIVLKNFMCHAHLDFKFGTNVNFIVGRNGSGKSAVLTAAIIGLGGSANCTNRGSAVKNFIQNGKQFSEISIKLHNRGQDAYKPNECGNAIYVVRRFLSTGVSDYKLMDEHKKVFSKKKEELNHILDHFNIQIDNPLCILNQDASRKFLQSDDPKNFYRLFLKGTQLAQMRDDYESIHAKKGQASVVLEHKRKAIPKLEKEEKEWKKKFDFLKSLEKLREKKLELNCELAWSKVAIMEKDLIDKKAELDSHTKEEGKLTSKFGESEKKVQLCQTKHFDAKNEINRINQELGNLKFSIEKLRTDATLKNSQQKNALLEAQKMNYKIKHWSSERDELIKKIKEVEKVGKDDLQKQKELRMKKIENLKAKRIEVEENYRDAEVINQQHKSKILEDRHQLADFKQKEEIVKRHLDASKRKLANLENSRTDYVKLFGDWVPNALAQIEEAYRQRKFKRKPLGPIGAFVKVSDPRWNLAIENCIKNLLFAFCCDNYHDERMLESILKKLIQPRKGTMPTIITSAFSDRVYNVEAHCAQSNQYPKILDRLIIDNHIITNCLIDQASVERILLIENPSEARKAMQRNPPRNCSMAYTMEGDQIYPSPKFRIYSSQKDKAGILQENIAGVILAVKNECSALESENQILKKQIAKFECQCSETSMQIKNSDANLMCLEQSTRKINNQIKELDGTEDPEPNEVATMEDELTELSSNVHDLQTNLNLCQDNASKLKEEYDKFIQERQQIEAKRSMLVRDTLDPLKEACGTFEEEKAVLIHEHQKLVSQLKKSHAEVDVLSEQTKELQTDFEQYSHMCAEKVGPRPMKVGKEQEIKREMKRIDDVLANRNSMYGDEAEITQRYAGVCKKIAQIKKDMESLESFLERLRISMVHRDEFYHHLRNHLSLKIKQHFTGFLSQRDYTGTLQFDHAKGELHVSVKTKPNDVPNNTEVKALSGGERSFSTVSFVLALWDSIESPFRMMDEFDVFMDMVNRRISLDMILRSAKANLSKQFIFFTPLDMNYLKSNSHTKIFKMRDPERSQPVLGSQANTTENVEEESAEER